MTDNKPKRRRRSKKKVNKDKTTKKSIEMNVEPVVQETPVPEPEPVEEPVVEETPAPEPEPVEEPVEETEKNETECCEVKECCDDKVDNCCEEKECCEVEECCDDKPEPLVQETPVPEPEPVEEPLVEETPVPEPEPVEEPLEEGLVSFESVKNPGMYLDVNEEMRCILSENSSALWRPHHVNGHVALELVSHPNYFMDAGYYDPYVVNKPPNGKYRWWNLLTHGDITIIESVVHKRRHLSSGSNNRPWTSNESTTLPDLKWRMH